jgi:hypothetical protein
LRSLPVEPAGQANTHGGRIGRKEHPMGDGVSDNSVVPMMPEPFASAGEDSLRKRSGCKRSGRPMTRIALLVAIALLAAGCGGDKSEVVAGPTLSEEALKQKCADPQWREKNLGIWYSVCRQPANW